MARGISAAKSTKAAKTMKPSGVAWIGDIPEGWEVNFLSQKVSQVKNRNDGLKEKNLLSLSYGKIKRKSIDSIGGLLPASFEGYNVIAADDIVLRLTDLQNDQHSLRIGLSRERGIVTSAYTTIRPNFQTDAIFLFYSLFAFDIGKGFYGMGSGVRQGLNYDEVKRMVVPIPPLPEQRAIADYLDKKCAAIDAAVAEAKKGIEEYKAWKKSLIFEMVTGKNRVDDLAANNPKVAKTKPSGIPWIGDIPEGWEVSKTLHALCMPITDGPHTTPDLFDDGIPFVSAEAVSCGNGRIDFDHIRGYISEAFYNECSLKYIPQRDDIYMIKSGATTGRVAIVDTDRRFTIWSPLAVFRCNLQRAKPRYVFYYLQSSAYQGQVELAWSFGTQQNIGMRALEELKVVLPSLAEQQAIADYLDEKCAAIDALVAEKEALIADFEAYKKSLIYETVTGKREVA